jgi:hypothetical protein
LGEGFSGGLLGERFSGRFFLDLPKRFERKLMLNSYYLAV